jgi:hypothetical protein
LPDAAVRFSAAARPAQAIRLSARVQLDAAVRLCATAQLGWLLGDKAILDGTAKCQAAAG